MRNRYISLTVGSIILLTAVALVVTKWFPLSIALRMVFGSFFVLFLPGFFLTWIFFPQTDSVVDRKHINNVNEKNDAPCTRALDFIERGTLSVIMSIVVISATVYTLYMIPPRGVHTSSEKVAWGIVVVNIICAAGAWKSRQKNFFKNK